MLKTHLFSKSDHIKELEEEVEDLSKLTQKQSDLLTAAVNVLKGPPPDLVLWSHHDIADLCIDIMTVKMTLDNHISELTEIIKAVIESGGIMDNTTEDHARLILDLPPPRRG